VAKKKGKEVEVIRREKKWPNHYDRIHNQAHVLTPKIKKFIYKYVSDMGEHTQEEFAKKFNVHVSTVINWLAWPETKQEIERLMNDYKDRALAGIGVYIDNSIKVLFKLLMSGETSPETRRKIARDFLSFGGLVDVNVARTAIAVQQNTAVDVSRTYHGKTIDEMSDEELKQELKELKELREA